MSFTTELKKHVKGDVLDDAWSLGIYATDASIYQIIPVAVILPRDEADVKESMAVARRHQIKILPRGGGTSLAGQTVGDAMILDFSRYMNQILEFNEEERWVRVQPGLVLDELNKELAPYNLHFAPDPATSSRANIGGMAGNNSSGTKSILYGKTVDHVLEARVVLSDGTGMHLKEYSAEEYEQIAGEQSREGEIYREFRRIVRQNKEEVAKRFPKVMRRVGGYNFDEFTNTDSWNLAKLVTGSEGTLAVALELKLNLEPLPKHKSVAVVHFAGLEEALRAVKPMLEYRPSAVEILDRIVLGLSRENLTTRHHCHFIEQNPEAILITEFYGDTPEEVMQRPREMVAELKRLGMGYAWPLFPEGKDYEDVWIVRKKGLGLMLGIKGEKKPLPFIEDAGIPVDRLPEYIREVLAICKKYHTDVSMYAHASVGVIHVRPILDLRQASDIENMKHIAEETFELVMKYHGSWSGEHGDGLVRSAFNERFFGTQLYHAFKEVKKLFDPANLMNPGKIVDAGPMDQNLRYGADYADRQVQTEFLYRKENSFRESVHMCTGVGECRKMLGGTMCPSYKATRDEEHSTRGRANALRMAMSGQLGHEGLTSERLREVLDLCLSCKACKSECPSNVDMAKMKSDISQMYFDQHGISLRDRMIRDSSQAASRLSGPLAGVINSIQKSALFRTILEKVAGFDRRRVLPEYAREPFSKWYAGRSNGNSRMYQSARTSQPSEVPETRKTPEVFGAPGIRAISESPGNTTGNAKRVVLFADTYMNYHEPGIGKAALELLESCGYEVIVAHPGCCQRPKISHGFLREAKKDGAATIDGLKPWLEQGLNILVCEPSCASALNDDFPDLIEDESLAVRLKKQVRMIDVFLAEEMEKGNITGDFESLGGDLLIHGHCHQKALYDTRSMKSICEKTGYNVGEIPSGCCGMAGSFGYEKEHYDLSQKIGESTLFPAVRSMDDGSTLVAGGFSCRHQIEHFTGVKPKHWVEVIRVRP
ncbi:MAG: FAD-linked oxidase C-terminal domain-containing protein [Balneolales bacterium]